MEYKYCETMLIFAGLGSINLGWGFDFVVEWTTLLYKKD